eukprot:747428-Hanusia_phi.AAC.1
MAAGEGAGAVEDARQGEQQEPLVSGEEEGEEGMESRGGDQGDQGQGLSSLDLHDAFRGSTGLPQSRDIEVDMGDGTPPLIISLIITREDRKKPYYGGYRHKVTGIEYHHAASQTEAPAKAQGRDSAAAEKFHRETQTKVASEKAMQAVRECGTQMARDDLLLDVERDYVIGECGGEETRGKGSVEEGEAVRDRAEGREGGAERRGEEEKGRGRGRDDRRRFADTGVKSLGSISTARSGRRGGWRRP